MAIAIEVENLSKQYRLGKIGTGSLAHDVNRWWHTVRGKEDPYLKIGEVNDRTQAGTSEYVWSLRDINFKIEQGDAVGIIGRNGAGKSTLLKILSRVTAPTTGSINIKGRVASLLEVGTGFHPELSGRENIFLNGAILGMRKAEVKRKFDEIVDFSGVERYIDTPVKRYSSGMYVRLAFAVAAHLESEILIVDEVLAVGDAEFQKKCLGKMDQVSKGEGRTLLFVSHNMGSIKTLCDKGTVLHNGQLIFSGLIEQAIDNYISNKEEQTNDVSEVCFEQRNEVINITKVRMLNSKHEITNKFLFGEPISVELTVKSKTKMNGISLVVGIDDKTNNRIFTSISDEINQVYNFEQNEEKIIVVSYTDNLVLSPNTYSLMVSVRSGHSSFYNSYSDIMTLQISEITYNNIIPHKRNFGYVRINPQWRELQNFN